MKTVATLRNRSGFLVEMTYKEHSAMCMLQEVVEGKGTEEIFDICTAHIDGTLEWDFTTVLGSIYQFVIAKAYANELSKLAERFHGLLDKGEENDE